MVEKVQKGDFLEIDYTGKLTDGSVFDTTMEKVAKENDLHSKKMQYSSATICVGEQQVLPGLDQALIGKEIPGSFTVNLQQENAFGKRDVKNIRIVPASTFKEHNVQPQPGLRVDVDGQQGTITRVSGGRIIVNFNHPLAGKEVVYDVTINKKVTDHQEQIVSFLNTTFRVPKEQVKVEVKEEKAEVTLPMALPPQIKQPLGEKLAELVKLKEVSFKQVSK
jgi:FKBP-type peptidyl-prolyl cis-trans isomerase SlyD